MDPISDMLIRIKNAQTARHKNVRMPYSKFKHEIARTLERAGLVKQVERKGKRIKKILDIGLIFKDEKPMITHIALFSKPSRRLYAPYRKLRSSSRGGMLIISTPKGVLSEKEARKEKVGGEIIAEIW